MSDQISTAHVKTFGTNAEHLAQQNGSRLKAAVMLSTGVGKQKKVVDQFGAVAPRRRTVRHGPTPQMDTPQDARHVSPHDYEWNDYVDRQDLLRMVLDPKSMLAEANAKAMGRVCDEEILAAVLGTSLTGEDGDVPITLPTAQKVVFGGGGLTFAKLREGKQLLMAANVDVDRDPIFMAITAQEHDNLYDFSNQVVVSSDFNDKRVLVEGMVHRFLGINFIHTELVGLDANGDRACPMWAKSGMHLCEWGGLFTRIDERPDLGYTTQVYGALTVGATRTEEVKVVEIAC